KQEHGHGLRADDRWLRQSPRRNPYHGTLLKTEEQIEGLFTGHGIQQRLQCWGWRGLGPRLPAALADAPGIKPALDVTQCPGQDGGRSEPLRAVDEVCGGV